jgi:hypothetical protein
MVDGSKPLTALAAESAQLACVEASMVTKREADEFHTRRRSSAALSVQPVPLINVPSDFLKHTNAPVKAAVRLGGTVFIAVASEVLIPQFVVNFATMTSSTESWCLAPTTGRKAVPILVAGIKAPTLHKGFILVNNYT